METTKKILKWVGVVLGGAFVLLVIVRAFHFYNLDKINAQVDIIHNTKLQLSDVMGDNLPPDPGAEADKTVAGVDANKNGIRDDVELAIFNKYPKSAKIRGPLLQYALTLQMHFTQPMLDKINVIEVVVESDRAYACVADTLVPRKDEESPRTVADGKKIDVFVDFVKDLQLNTEERKQSYENFYHYLGSYGDSENEVCDLDYSNLPN